MLKNDQKMKITKYIANLLQKSRRRPNIRPQTRPFPFCRATRKTAALIQQFKPSNGLLVISVGIFAIFGKLTFSCNRFLIRFVL